MFYKRCVVTKVQRNYKDTVSQILRLAEAFEVPTEDPELELRVTILNINPKMNEELKEKCQVLKQYTQYVERVRYK